jgi:hypothetical protein
MAYDRYTATGLTVLLNSDTIRGVIGFNGNFSINKTLILDLESGILKSPAATDAYATDDYTAAQFSITRNMFWDAGGNDPMRFLTGKDPVSGQIIWGVSEANTVAVERCFGFKTGYLTNYKVEGSVDGTVLITADFIAWGKFGFEEGSDRPAMNQTAMYDATKIMTPLGPGNCQFLIDKIDLPPLFHERIVNWSYEISCEREPLFMMHEISPTIVLIKNPMSVTATFQFDVENYEGRKSYETFRYSPDYLEQIHDLEFYFYTGWAGCSGQTKTEIWKEKELFEKMERLGETVSATLTSALSDTVVYRRFIATSSGQATTPSEGINFDF